jgi:hypothetical protein
MSLAASKTGRLEERNTCGLRAEDAVPPTKNSTTKTETEKRAMKFISVYSIPPGCLKEAASRFLKGEATPPAGIKLLGRWHRSDASGGYSLFEADSPAVMYEFAATWADVLDLHSNMVLDDSEAGPVLAKVFK